jgi:endophilin-B1
MILGSALIKAGETEKKLGVAEKEFVQRSIDSFVQPLKSFLDGQMKTIQKEKKVLEIKRLDLDACKAKLKRSREDRSKNSEVSLPEVNFNSLILISYFISVKVIS